MSEAQDSVSRIEFETALMRQEHRLFRILMNYVGRSQYAKDDPRRMAVTEALLWRLVIAATPVTVAGGASIIAIIGLFTAWRSNQLLAEQNDITIAQSRAQAAHAAVDVCNQWYTQLQAIVTTKSADWQATATHHVTNYDEKQVLLPQLIYHAETLRNASGCRELVDEIDKFLTIVAPRKDPFAPLECVSLDEFLLEEKQNLKKLYAAVQRIAAAAAKVDTNLTPTNLTI